LRVAIAVGLRARIRAVIQSALGRIPAPAVFAFLVVTASIIVPVQRGHLTTHHVRAYRATVLRLRDERRDGQC
jgi:hypothetical protein